MSPDCDINSIAWSEDGKYLACGPNDTQPIFYSMDTQESTTLKPGHMSSVMNVFFDPTSTYICSTGCEGVVNIYNIELILQKSKHALVRTQKICGDTKLDTPQQLKSAW